MSTDLRFDPAAAIAAGAPMHWADVQSHEDGLTGEVCYQRALTLSIGGWAAWVDSAQTIGLVRAKPSALAWLVDHGVEYRRV